MSSLYLTVIGKPTVDTKWLLCLVYELVIECAFFQLGDHGSFWFKILP